MCKKKEGEHMNSEQEYYVSLVERLRQMPEETEWLEYKVNNCEPELIGEYISALSILLLFVIRKKRIYYGE